MNRRSLHKTRSKGGTEKLVRPASASWSVEVTRKSNALDLEAGVFALDDPRKIARSLKGSADASARRKSAPFQSAMSMLTFYINRAGTTLSPERKDVLERAKAELRKEFGRSLER